MVVCAPTGAVTFIFNGWGGRVSDKEIIIKSVFLDWIEHGDKILADRGFIVAKEIATMGVLEIPAFTKEKRNCYNVKLMEAVNLLMWEYIYWTCYIIFGIKVW